MTETKAADNSQARQEGTMSTPLSGVISALATPFTADGRLDQGLLRRLVDRNIDGGVGGVVAGGSTGEFASMTPDERRLLVETVVDQTAGRVPVVAQTGAMSAKEAIELSRHAQEAGADVLMVVAPYYEALTVSETLHYLRRVADSVQVPVMLYNIPAHTGVNLTPDLVREIATDVDNVAYIKDTTGDMAQAAQLIHHHGDVISTFVGWDSLCLAAFVEGAAGAVAGAANVIPAELVSVHAAVRAGDLAGARAQWDRIYPLIDALLGAPFIAAVKAALREFDFPIGLPRDPVQDVDPETLSTISALAKALRSTSVVPEGANR
jgi:4-hydroxy-tetrahydrodipicolinate synthase